MKTLWIGTALFALATAAQPASAQLLGGGGLGGQLGGSLGGASGALGGHGMLDRTLEPGRAMGDGTASARTSSRTSKAIDARNGRVTASHDSTADGTGGGTATLGDRTLSGSGSAGGTAGGGVDAQLVGTDALRGAASRATQTAGTLAGRGRDAAGNAVGRTRTVAADTLDRAQAVGGGAAASGSGSGSGMLATGSGTAAGGGMLALSGQGGGIPVAPGMAVNDARGRAIGTVESVRSGANGAVQRVLVHVGNRVADLPAANFSAGGDALVSAMGRGAVKNAAE